MEHIVKKDDKGITLIALIVTIIMLLILAGVSISMLTGQNGIINRAKQAKSKTRYATVKELVSIWKNERMLDLPNLQNLKELLIDMVQKGYLTEDEYNIVNDTSFIKDGCITVENEKIELNPSFLDYVDLGIIQIGDYIEYFPDEQSNDIKWQLLECNDDNIILISEKPLTSSMSLYGVNGYLEAEDNLNDFCARYR